MEQARQIFSAVAGLDESARQAYYAEASVPEDIRKTVEELLRFDQTGGGTFERFLDEHIAGIAGSASAGGAPAEGERFGPYKLVRLIAQGGMGSVYLGERADGEVDQRAAIKLLNWGDDALRSRFLLERQILARLEHPAIARLLDTGQSAQGKPYIAMEYVEGVPIDQFAANLDWRSRVRLFLQVCDAVSYAHRNLIVHRDLKPSNLLVDTAGRVKLLDFGIAKVLNEAASAVSTVLAMTPQYASPEQCAGKPVTTATDIYSLGVVLYKMVSGRLPYNVEPGSNPAAYAQVICETEPAAPNVDPDLDKVLLMALRKEPERRYLSVEQFSGDLSRVLADEPILARTPSWGYRLQKFVRRNRTSVGIAAVAALGIIAAVALAVGQWRASQRRFEEVRHLAHTFVFDLDDQIARIQGTTQARETIVKTGLSYLDSLAKDAAGDPGLEEEVAAGYTKIGEIQGFPTEPNLGHAGDALTSFRKAATIYERLASRPEGLTRRAWFQSRFGFLLTQEQKLAEAGQAYRASLTMYQQAAARGQLSFDDRLSHAKTVCQAGDLEESNGHLKQAAQMYNQCTDMGRALLKESQAYEVLSFLGNATERVATSQQDAGELAAALRSMDENQALLDQQIAAKPLDTVPRRRAAVMQQYRASLYFDDVDPNYGDAAKALEPAKRYSEAAQWMVDHDRNDTGARYSYAVATFRLAMVLSQLDPPRAVQMGRDALAQIDALLKSGKNSRLLTTGRITALRRLALAEFKARHLDAAQLAIDEALAAERVQAKSSAGERQKLSVILALAARISSARGNSARMRELIDEARQNAAGQARSGEFGDRVIWAMTEETAGDLLAADHHPAEAQAAYQRLLQIWTSDPDQSELARIERARAEKLAAAGEQAGKLK